MTGVVFDIQRFALHDGPGIRTTVFLKGCPLRCLWCHNPESQAHEPELAFNREICVDCDACATAEREGLRALRSGPSAIDLRSNDSLLRACPHGALTMIGEVMSVDAVIDEVLRDEDYYQRSGGGMTLSGGEPLAQFEFSMALLIAAKRLGLHTCLDTCGMASPRRLKAVMPFVDLFLFDYKATDPVVHAELTGAANGLIVENIELLCAAGAAVRLRFPLVPGVNDTDDHLQAIASLERRHPGLEGVEIMPYHDLGRDKAARVGRDYSLAHVKPAADDVKAAWLGSLRSYGATRVVVA